MTNTERGGKHAIYEGSEHEEGQKEKSRTLGTQSWSRSKRKKKERILIIKKKKRHTTPEGDETKRFRTKNQKPLEPDREGERTTDSRGFPKRKNKKSVAGVMREMRKRYEKT